MTKNEATRFIANLFDDVWTELQEDKLSQYYHPTLKGYLGDQAINFQDVANRLKYVKDHYRSIKNDVSDVLVDGDKIVVRNTQTVTSKHTDQQQSYQVIAIYKMQNQKVSEIWACINPGVDYFAK